MNVGVKFSCLMLLQTIINANGALTGELKIAGIFESIQLHQAAFTYSNTLYNSEKEIKDVPISYVVDSSILKDEPFSALKGTCLFLKKGIVGLFGPQSTLNLNIVQSITERKDIPHLLTRYVSPSQMGSQTINFYPSPTVLADGFFDIINALEWQSFTVLHTDSENLLQITEFIAKAKENGIIVYIDDIDPDKSGKFRPALHNAARSGQKNFVLDCPIGDLQNLFSQLQQVGLLSAGFNYFLTNLDAHTEDLKSYMYSDAVITGVHFTKPNMEVYSKTMGDLCHIYNITFKIGCDTPELDIETALILDSVKVFLETLKAEEVTQGQYSSCDNDGSWAYGLSIINTLKQGAFEGITGQIEFGNDGYRSSFEFTIYQMRGDDPIIRGTWNTTVGLSEDLVLTFNDEEKPNEDTGLHESNLNVEISLTQPYAQLRESARRLTGNDRFEGFAIDLIEQIAMLVGFEYTFIVRDDHKHGVFDTLSGKWTGMIGDVIEGVADLAISDLTINKDRVDPVEFTQPFMSLGISILFRKPEDVPVGFFYFAEPFSVNFWQILGISYLIIVCSLFLIGRLSPSEWQRVETCKESKKYLENDLTFLNSLWFVSAAVFKQTTNVKIRSISARIISATWWLFCFVLVAMYISFSLSRNAVVEKEEVFEDVAGLLDYAEENDIKFGALKGGATEAFFKNSRNIHYQKVAEYMEEHPEDMVDTTAEGISRAEKGDYAFFMESATIEYTIRRHCDLASYGGLLDEKGFGIAVRKGSPLLPHLNRAILKLKSSGGLLDLKRKWWEEKYAGEVCEDDDESEVSPKTVEHINGIVALTFAGIALAMVLAFLEFLVHVYGLSKRLKQPYGKTFNEELKKCFGRKRTVQYVEEINLTKPENGRSSPVNKDAV